MEFLGCIIKQNDVQPNKSAIASVQKCATPTSKIDARSFLGLINYYRPFVPNFAKLAIPLYNLLKEESKFHWSEDEKRSFELLKDSVISCAPLACYNPDPTVKTILTTDASGKGIGAVLSQIHEGKSKPVYFISRHLRGAEASYSSSELETLAIVWAVERLHQFLYGRPFEVHTDHCALKTVLMGSMKNSVAPARIVRWATRLLPYNFTTHYIRGSTNVVADCLSRLPSEDKTPFKELAITVAALQGDSLPCVSYKEVRQYTKDDNVLQKVCHYIHTTWPNNQSLLQSDLQQFWRFRNEFSIHNDVLFRGDKVIAPMQLRSRLIDFAQEGYFGIAKSKARLRRSYWWPQMDQQVEEEVRKCHCCRQAIRDSPVQIPQWPSQPWNHLAVDIAGPKKDINGKPFYIVAMIDCHSKYVVAEIIMKITS